MYYDAFDNLTLAICSSNFPLSSALTWTRGIWGQVVVAAAIEAKAIVDESPATANHANRLLWAQYVLQNTLMVVPLFAYGVMQDAAIEANGTGASADADVQAAMNALVPALVDGMVF